MDSYGKNIVMGPQHGVLKWEGALFSFLFSSSGTALNHAERPVITWEPVLGLALYFVVLETRGI